MYQILEKHFLAAQGNGRWISIPLVTCTNKQKNLNGIQPSVCKVRNAVIVKLDHFYSRNKLSYQFIWNMVKMFKCAIIKTECDRSVENSQALAKTEWLQSWGLHVSLAPNIQICLPLKHLNKTLSKQSDVQLVGVKTKTKPKCIFFQKRIFLNFKIKCTMLTRYS